MKRLLFIFLFITTLGNAQTFLKAGIGYSWLSNKYSSSVGYQIGWNWVIPFKNKHLFISPEVNFSFKRANYSDTLKHQIQLNYIEPGVIFGYSGKYLFGHIGNSLSITVFSKDRKRIDNRSFSFAYLPLKNNVDIIQSIGFGYKFTIKSQLFYSELRYSLGYLSSLDKAHNNLLLLCLWVKI